MVRARSERINLSAAVSALLALELTPSVGVDVPVAGPLDDGLPVDVADRPHPGHGLPEVLLVGEAVEPGHELAEHGVQGGEDHRTHVAARTGRRIHHGESQPGGWSGRRESNPHHRLGRPKL